MKKEEKPKVRQNNLSAKCGSDKEFDNFGKKGAEKLGDKLTGRKRALPAINYNPLDPNAKPTNQQLVDAHAFAKRAFVLHNQGVDAYTEDLVAEASLYSRKVEDARIGLPLDQPWAQYMVQLLQTNQMQSNIRLEAINNTLNNRLDAMDQAFNNRLDAMDQTFNNRINVMDQALNNRINVMDQAFNNRINVMDQAFNNRINAMDQALNNRLHAVEQVLNQVIASTNKLEVLFSAEYMFNTKQTMLDHGIRWPENRRNPLPFEDIQLQLQQPLPQTIRALREMNQPDSIVMLQYYEAPGNWAQVPLATSRSQLASLIGVYLDQ